MEGWVCDTLYVGLATTIVQLRVCMYFQLGYDNQALSSPSPSQSSKFSHYKPSGTIIHYTSLKSPLKTKTGNNKGMWLHSYAHTCTGKNPHLYFSWMNEVGQSCDHACHSTRSCDDKSVSILTEFYRLTCTYMYILRYGLISIGGGPMIFETFQLFNTMCWKSWGGGFGTRL